MQYEEQRTKKTTSALWITEAYRAELKEGPEPVLNTGDILVRTQWSGISRGTERLVFEGRVPVSETGRMRAPMQEGRFPFPVKYGYSTVGIVEQGPPDLQGRRVFALHPHQDLFAVPLGLTVPVPEDVPPKRAVLAANLETALNAIWDGGCGPGDRIVVVGGGVVGLLTAHLASRIPGTEVTLVDVDPDRRALVEHLGASFATPEDAPSDADIVFHASASAQGLGTALVSAGFEARVVEMSWYGSGAVNVTLGGAFHSQRLQLVSSQVGHLPPSRRARWTTRRRLAAALHLLYDQRLDVLVAEEVPFSALPEALHDILCGDGRGIPPVVAYS
ncbi:zinc-dependent alcohol dehydrogenase [Microvirga aerophila]|uniref:Dehydrogenase n=1 Tax=Microvirga aerophila TaxID=670291 RepID=A0A512BSM4_9HYPH|nr:zinc-binding alcohol dehydrogenase [Microvirga aerophila]GEO14979.1 dehydrogenase [Microvirga aerophila]